MESPSFSFILSFIAVFFMIGGVAMVIAHNGKAERLVRQWSAENGVQLLECEKRWLRCGPFFFSKSKSQRVFRIIVSDSAGNVFRGYAKCGGYFLGMWSEQIEVRWDPEPAYQPGFPVIVGSKSPTSSGGAKIGMSGSDKDSMALRSARLIARSRSFRRTGSLPIEVIVANNPSRGCERTYPSINDVA